MNEHNSITPTSIFYLYECLVSNQDDLHSLLSTARSALEQAEFEPDLAESVEALVAQGGLDQAARSKIVEQIEAYGPVYRYRCGVNDVWTVYRFDLTSGEEHWCATVDTEAWADLMVSIGNGRVLTQSA